jgi:hypothetical protein
VDSRVGQLTWTGLTCASSQSVELPLRLLGASRTPQLWLLSVEGVRLHADEGDGASLHVDEGAGAAVLALGPRLRVLRLRRVVLGKQAGAVTRALGSLRSLTELDVSGTDVAGEDLARSLPSLRWLQTLRLARAPGGAPAPAALRALSALSELRVLDLRGNSRPTAAALDAALASSLGSPGLRSLRTLCLADSGVGVSVVAALPALRGLRELDLRAAHLWDGGGLALDAALRALTGLVRLDLAEVSGVATLGRCAAVLGALSALSGLRALAVDGLLDGGGDAALAAALADALAAALRAMPGLRSLSASFWQLGADVGFGGAVCTCAALATLTQLRELRLDGLLCAERAAAVAAPLAAALAKLRDLRVLRLARPYEGPDGDAAGRAAADAAAAAVVAALAASGAPLVELDLRAGGAAAPALAALLGGLHASLRALTLRDAALGSAGAALLAPALARTTGLRVLDLDDNQLDTAGVAALQQAFLRLERLEVLSLNYNNINTLGIDALAPGLAAMTSLRVLQLCGNNFAHNTHPLMDAVRNRMPRLDVLNVDSAAHHIACTSSMPARLIATREVTGHALEGRLAASHFNPEDASWRLEFTHNNRQLP